ncbi:hypothetical protein SGPA1_10982 [Streptomyces misionensis JCM 4497]
MGVRSRDHRHRHHRQPDVQRGQLVPPRGALARRLDPAVPAAPRRQRRHHLPRLGAPAAAGHRPAGRHPARPAQPPRGADLRELLAAPRRPARGRPQRTGRPSLRFLRPLPRRAAGVPPGHPDGGGGRAGPGDGRHVRLVAHRLLQADRGAEPDAGGRTRRVDQEVGVLPGRGLRQPRDARPGRARAPRRPAGRRGLRRRRRRRQLPARLLRRPQRPAPGGPRRHDPLGRTHPDLPGPQRVRGRALLHRHARPGRHRALRAPAPADRGLPRALSAPNGKASSTPHQRGAGQCTGTVVPAAVPCPAVRSGPCSARIPSARHDLGGSS